MEHKAGSKVLSSSNDLHQKGKRAPYIEEKCARIMKGGKRFGGTAWSFPRVIGGMLEARSPETKRVQQKKNVLIHFWREGDLKGQRDKEKE